MKALWKQFNIGAINGFLFGFGCALIFDLSIKLILLFKLHHSISYLEPAPMMYTDFLKASISCLFAAGLAKLISYFLFRKPKNIFIEWLQVGLVTMSFLYLLVLVENTIDFFTTPIDFRFFQWIFVESLDITTWLFGLLFLSLYNLLFAYVLKSINKTAGKSI